MKKAIILRKVHVKMKLYAPLFSTTILQETKHINAHALETVLQQEILIGANVRSSHWMCFVKKGVLKNFAKVTRKHLCQSLFLNKVAGLRPLFSQSNSGRLLLECGHCPNETREIARLCCREVDAMLIASAKSWSVREACACRHPAFIGICPTISHTC